MREHAGGRSVKSGAVTVVQRVSSDLRLNPHLHTVALDGVFVAAADDDIPVFVPLPRLESADVRDLLAVVRARVLRFLVRRGVIDDDESFTVAQHREARCRSSF